MIKLSCRKNLADLSESQRDDIVSALLTLKSNGQYDKYADQHDTYFGTAHGNSFFYPWHRKFLGNLEKELQAINPDIALPYWDSTTSQSPSELPWTSNFMGGTGSPVSGPFAAWGLERALDASGSLPSAGDIADDQALVPYSNHWSPAEGTHGPPHNWVGGNMAMVRSPEDPIFFLHHCYVDKWWSDWQLAHPTEDAYQGSGSSSPTSAMAPWSTTPNDVLDSVDLDYIYDTDPSRVSNTTTSLNFVDIPEGEETVRGIVISVVTCSTLSFNIVSGPGPDFGAPFGTSVPVDPGDGAVRGDAIVWISYQGTTAGDDTSGTITVECPQTGDSWNIPITANTVARPTVGVALVLDKSSSMLDDIGDGRSRNDLLIESAMIFTQVIQEANGLGIAAFDENANKVMDIKEAGPPGSVFGTGRADALANIVAHTPNPGGFTSIGDGVEVGSMLTSDASGSFDESAMVVFTDGKENRPNYIADIGSLIGNKVFAIGLGTATDLNAAALTQLCNNSGGEMLLTDTIDPMDDFFKLSKYYLQILAGITNFDIVSDPEDWISPGEKHRIPFNLIETDISHDVILLCPAAQVVRLTLETPHGDIIDPAFAGSSIGVTYVPGKTFSYYRVTLPVVDPGGNAAKEGEWAALLEVDDDRFKKYVGSLDGDQQAIGQILTHGVRYNVGIYSLSNLRLRGILSQNSYEPGAILNLRCTLNEYGLPLVGDATVVTTLTRPDGTESELILPRIEQGVFETQVTALLAGVYTAHARAVGKTARGRAFTREHIFTGAVWTGGDNPFPTSTDDYDEHKRCLCELLQCLMGPQVLTDEFEKQLENRGINLQAARKCVDRWCKCGLHSSSNQGMSKPDLSPSSIESVITRLSDRPELVRTLITMLESR